MCRVKTGPNFSTRFLRYLVLLPASAMSVGFENSLPLSIGCPEGNIVAIHLHRGHTFTAVTVLPPSHFYRGHTHSGMPIPKTIIAKFMWDVAIIPGVPPKSGTLDFHYLDIRKYSIFWFHQIKDSHVRILLNMRELFTAVHKFSLCFVYAGQWTSGQQCMEVRIARTPV